MGVGNERDEEACSGWSLDGRLGAACCTKHDRRSQMGDTGAASCRQRAQSDRRTGCCLPNLCALCAPARQSRATGVQSIPIRQ